MITPKSFDAFFNSIKEKSFDCFMSELDVAILEKESKEY